MNHSGFIALVGSTPSPRLRRFRDRLERKPGFATLVEGPELVVFGEPEAAHLILPRSAGIVWGHVFERSTGQRLQQGDGEALAGFGVEEMLARCWGGYVWMRARGGKVEVLREPSGMVGCYHAEIDGFHLVTSLPHLLIDLGLLAPAIDWTIVAQSLGYRDLRPAQTGLRGISEILPGVRLEIARGACRAITAWSPWTFARRDAQILDPQIATATLREAARSALAAWSQCFVRPMIEISGGLDSAIVATGFQHGQGEPRCVTFGPEAGDASELPWARAVAERLGLELAELVPESDEVDITLSEARDLPRPCARAFTQAMDRPLQRLAREWSTDGFFGGGGGDSIFCFQHSSRPVLDRYRDTGFGPGLLRTAADMARLTRTDIWTVLLGAVRQSLRAPSAMPRPQTNRFLNPAVMAGLPWPSGHPWLEAPKEISPGKRNHVWSIIAIQNHLEGYGREKHAPYLSPLMSQPILEACLRIPSWQWCLGGNNRTIAREAFRDQLPASVIQRTSKLSFGNLVLRVIEANRAVLREMVFGGRLAQEGLIDAAALSESFDAGPIGADAVSELMAVAEAETWVRAWEGRSGHRD